MKPENWCRWDGEDLIVRVRAQPRSKADGLAGVIGDALRVRLTAPPVDGKANQQLIRVLAAAFGVPRSKLRIEKGENRRDKLIRVRAPGGLSVELARLARPIAS